MKKIMLEENRNKMKYVIGIMKDVMECEKNIDI